MSESSRADFNTWLDKFTFWNALRRLCGAVEQKKGVHWPQNRRVLFDWDFLDRTAPAEFGSEQIAAIGCRPDHAIRVIHDDLGTLPQSADNLPVTWMQALRIDLQERHGSLENARKALRRLASGEMSTLYDTPPHVPKKSRTPHFLRYLHVHGVPERRARSMLDQLAHQSAETLTRRYGMPMAKRRS